MSDEPKHVLMVRPNRVGPSWWETVWQESVDASGRWCKPLALPCAALPIVGTVAEYAWWTVTSGGGFTKGFDLASAVTGDAELGERIDEWFESHEDDPWPWEIRAIRLP
jgi:hypothetical protein